MEYKQQKIIAYSQSAKLSQESAMESSTLDCATEFTKAPPGDI